MKLRDQLWTVDSPVFASFGALAKLPNRLVAIFYLLCAASMCWEPVFADGPDSSDFNNDIRPIFRKHCTVCHGGVKNAGGISFVYREQALGMGESGKHIVVPGKPDESELVRRIEATNDERMPPPDHGLTLDAGDVARIRRWIKDGAKWNELWSLQPITNPPLPQVRRTNWGAISLDKFVLAELEKQGVEPSVPASPAAWLRRVTLDLIGLPPTVDEFDAFSKEYLESPRQAKQNVVARLLSSESFGERWATVWLDLARYSDTYGMEKDPNRTIWPWRDWVIRAFNADMPYDQFTLKQMAGDLLEDAKPDDILATAFHRNTQNNTEGGTDDEEFRFAAVVDRVNTIWTTWNATTFGCVRCHAHPYEPYPQQDYYRFAALWNNAEDCDQNDDFPWLRWANQPTDRDRLWALQRKQLVLRNEINQSGHEVVKQAEWSSAQIVKATTSAGEIVVGDSGKVTASGTLPIGVRYQIAIGNVAGAQAIRFRLSPDSDDPLAWPERGQVLSDIKASRPIGTDKSEPVPLRYVVADYLSGPYDPNDTLTEGAPGFGSYPVMTGPRWCVVVLAEPLPADATSLDLTLIQSAASNSGFQAVPLRKFAIDVSRDGRWSEWRNSDHFSNRSNELKECRDAIKSIQSTNVPVIFERSGDARRETRVLRRGNRLTPGDAIVAGVPSLLSKNREIQSRRAFAEWLCSEEHPLTSRTLANRLWAEMYGAGIVETLEDFGTSGATPSNPQLLDHLAWRLSHEHRWSIKSFLKEIALSDTYGQTAAMRRELVESDPNNRWLARGPRSRLTAEMIRDQALAVSGKLSKKLYGPPVFPPQPEGIWNSVYNGQTWTTSTGEDRYRRSLYTFQKRTSGYPGFLSFDAPTRELCSARRIATNTPLQALVTLNDPGFFELAQGYAARMKQSSSQPSEQIRFGCRVLTLDSPPESMVSRLLGLYEDVVKELSEDTESSKKLGETAQDAALVIVANTLLNLDSSMVR